MSAWTAVGTHTLTTEDDLVFIRFSGVFTLPDVKIFLSCLEQVYEKYGRLYILFDGSHVTTIEPAARRLFVQWNKDYPITAVANFGGGAMQRALAFLLYNAIRLLVKRTPEFIYTTTEAQARAWLDTQRRQPPG